MFLKVTWTTHKGKKRKYGSVVETYRENGKIKHKHIKSLGYLETTEDIQKAQRLIEKLKAGKTMIMLEDLDTKRNRDYGIIYVADELWKRYGMKSILDNVADKTNVEFDMERIVFLLTVNRLHNPSSDLCAYEWMKNDAYTGSVKIELQYLYRALDKLKKHKLHIEKGLLKSLKKNLDLKVDVVFYDLTGVYFEGEGTESAGFGFSRCIKRGKKQLVLGLVLADGIPITHRIWPGNTTDKTTLKEAVKNLKKDFNIRNTVFVADRGLITADELDDKKYDYIIATRRRRDSLIEQLMLKSIETTENGLYAEKVHTEEGDGKEKKDRHYILCIDTDTRKGRLEALKRIRHDIEKKLSEMNGTEKDLNAKVVKILGKNKRLFNYDTSKGLSFSLNNEAWKYENEIAGKFMLVTTKDMKPEEAMKQYKELKDIERAFKELKSFIKVRPVNHSTDERTEGHVFVCVLSLLIRRLIERSCGMTADKALQELRRLRVNEEVIDEETIYRRNELSDDQKKILKEMNIEEPLKIIFS